jgi:hypothetical protein
VTRSSAKVPRRCPRRAPCCAGSKTVRRLAQVALIAAPTPRASGCSNRRVDRTPTWETTYSAMDDCLSNISVTDLSLDISHIVSGARGEGAHVI